MYILFVGPADQDAEWNDKGVEGIARFLRRLWRAYSLHVGKFDKDWSGKLAGAEVSEGALAVRRKLHQTLAKVNDDIQSFHFNTSVAAQMELLNAPQPWADGLAEPTEADLAVLSEALEQFARLLSVFVPHLADELWETLGFEGSLLEQTFPMADPALLVLDTVEVPVQINGKVRGVVTVPAGASAEEMQAIALADEKLKDRFEGVTIIKAFAKPGQMVSFVVK
jgi:leucyl-tRNA synthetase